MGNSFARPFPRSRAKKGVQKRQLFPAAFLAEKESVPWKVGRNHNEKRKQKKIYGRQNIVPVYPLYVDLKALLLRRPPGAVLSRVSSIEGTWHLKDSPEAGDLGIAPSVSSGGAERNLPSTSSELDSIDGMIVARFHLFVNPPFKRLSHFLFFR